jgi:hypothetical protein
MKNKSRAFEPCFIVFLHGVSKILKTPTGIISIAILECKKISNVAHRNSALIATVLIIVLKYYCI